MQAHSLPSEPSNSGNNQSTVGSTGDSARNMTASSRAGRASLVALPLIAEEKARRARRLRVVLLSGRIAADGFLLVAAFIFAYWLRYSLTLGRDLAAPESFLPLSAFYPYIAAYVMVTLLTFHTRGLYALPRGASWFEHARIITSGALIGVSALTLGALVFTPVLPSRLVFIYLWICTILLFSLERFLYRSARVWLWRRGVNIRKALVVGAGLAGQRIMKDIVERPELGYKLAGYLSDGADTPRSPSWRVPVRARNGSELQRLGSLKEVSHIIGSQELHEVIVALPATHHAQILDIIDSCREYGLDFKLVPDLFEMRFNEVRIDALNGVPLIGVKDTALQGFNLFVKRALDIVFAVLAFAVATVPMAIIAIIIKLSSRGPVLIRQVRVGKGGKEFTCYKFRSMYEDADERLEEVRHLNEAQGPMFKIRDDPRRTPVGRFLRTTSLDELPQLYNILKGEMSWVGPRPPRPQEAAEYSEWQRKRLEVTPGLTGLWQISGRSDLPFDEMVKLDLYYAENWSLAVDLMIILRTIPAVLKREGAY